MSYILDALKKSDQERQQGNNPTLQTIHKPHFSGGTPSKWRLIALFMGVCVVSLVAVAVWFVAAYGVDKQSIEVADRQVVAGRAAARGSESPLEAEAAVSNETVIAKNEVNKNRAIERLAINTVVEFADLPDPVQQAIPSLIFSFHVYSANVDRRTIIINKRRVKEGAVVSEGLTLIEITEKGVVLDWKKRYRFMIDVVENW
jgi:general secretion pathway protein B